MSTRTWGAGLVAAALTLGLSVAPMEAQRGQGVRGMGPGGQGGPNMGRSIELALDNREALEITDEQVAQLQELQRIIQDEIGPLAEEMRTIRESVRGGDLDRAEARREMEALRGKIITAGAPLGGGVREILTVAQHERLQAIVSAERGGRGVGSALRGRRGPGMGRSGPGGFQQGRGVGLNSPRRRGSRGFQSPGNGPGRRGLEPGIGLGHGVGMGPFLPRTGRGGWGPNGPIGDFGDPSTES